MKKFLLKRCYVLLLLLTVGTAYAQERSVSGKVTSAEDGSALPGVNVVLKGTTAGTVTDAAGSYQLNVPASGGALIFSFIGFKSTEVVIGDRNVVEVALSLDATQLSEVVVTALGIEKTERSIGYAVGKVKAAELTQANATNVGTALSGKVAGLQINTVNNGVNPATRIVLRGNRSLAGNNQALVVIDGVQVPNEALNYLNPNDVESVNVLKGPGAAALYGSDGANGALIVTTKKGSKTAPQITYSFTAQQETINYLPKLQDRFGGGTNAFSRDYISFENQSYGPAFDGSTVLLGRVTEDGNQESGKYSAVKDGKLNAFDKGSTVQHDLSFGTADEKSSFFASFQRVDTKGIVPKDENSRTTLRINADRTFGKLKVGSTVSYSLRNTKATNSPFYANVLNSPANIDVGKYRNWRPLFLGDGSNNYASPNNYFNDYIEPPYFALDRDRAEDRINYLIASLEASYKVADWINLLYRVGVTNDNGDFQDWSEKFSYTDYAAHSGKSIAAGNFLGFSQSQTSYINRFNSDFMVTFNKKFGDFSTNLLLGNNVRQTRRGSNAITANELVIPGLYNPVNRIGEAGVGSFESLQRSYSFYGSLTVGYKDFLTLEVTGRNDNVSVLNDGNNSIFYPGAALSFVATDALEILKDNSILNYAKFFLSASNTGNVSADPYDVQTIYTSGLGFPYGSLAGFSLGNTSANPNLKPEFTKAFEIGGEFTLLNDRIGLDLAYSKTQTTDQTVTVDIANTTGFSRARLNTGRVDNDIYEVTLKTTPINTSYGLRVDVNVNYTNVETEVVELFGETKSINLSNLYSLTTDQSLGQIFAEVGQNYPIVKATAYARDPQGRVIVNRETGYPVASGELKTFGQANPKHTLGIQANVKFKNFNLSALAEYRGGNVIYHGVAATSWFTGVSAATVAYDRERFVFPNSVYEDEDGSFVENTDVVTQDGGLGAWDSNLRVFGENFVTSGAFWKLREATLGYTVPKSVLEKIGFIKSVYIAFVGRNLLTILPKENIYNDPEFAVSTTNAVGLSGTQTNTPPTRTYGFTFKINF